VINEYNGSIDSLPDTRLEEFVRRNPTDIFAGLTLAQRFSARDEYAKADTLLTRILKIDENYLPALQMISGLKRQEGDVAGSIRYCNQIIDMDRENMYALSSKARSLLKMHKDKEALDLAKRQLKLTNRMGIPRPRFALLIISMVTKEARRADFTVEKR
jgi:tetratricopeptide (TPR) repeat protein